MPTNRGMDKDVVHVYSGILLSQEKEQMADGFVLSRQES